MLVLSRYKDESIVIGDDIEITVVRFEGRYVKLSINAPDGCKILRGELYEKDNSKFEQFVNDRNYDDALALLEQETMYAPPNDLVEKCRDGFESEGR